MHPQLPTKHINKVHKPNSEEYYTDESGNVFIYVNIWGHVSRPGSYLVSEGSDIMTIISQAGGPLSGANLRDTFIYSNNSQIKKIDLYSYLNSEKIEKIIIKANDTIVIKQSWSSYLFSNSNVINSILQIVNISLLLSNID